MQGNEKASKTYVYKSINLFGFKKILVYIIKQPLVSPPPKKKGVKQSRINRLLTEFELLKMSILKEYLIFPSFTIEEIELMSTLR